MHPRNNLDKVRRVNHIGAHKRLKKVKRDVNRKRRQLSRRHHKRLQKTVRDDQLRGGLWQVLTAAAAYVLDPFTAIPIMDYFVPPGMIIPSDVQDVMKALDRLDEPLGNRTSLPYSLTGANLLGFSFYIPIGFLRSIPKLIGFS